MKKILYIAIFMFLSACAGEPPEMIYDNQCSPIKSLTVMRVYNDLILGWASETPDMSSYSPNEFYQPGDEHYVYLPADKDSVYYPGQTIYLPESTCVKYTGMYSYLINNQYGAQTLKGAFEPAFKPNPDYAEFQRHKRETQYIRCQIIRKKAQNSKFWQRRFMQTCQNQADV